MSSAIKALKKILRISFWGLILHKEIGGHISFGLNQPEADLSIPCVRFTVDINGNLGNAMFCHLALELKTQAEKGIVIN